MADEKKIVDELDEMTGAFVASLTRNNKQIKRERAVSIAEDAGIRYKREVEDLEIKLKRMRREQENMLDLSPDNVHSLMVAKDFDSAAYVQKDIDLGISIRETKIKLDIARDRYDYLFGGE